MDTKLFFRFASLLNLIFLQKRLFKGRLFSGIEVF